MGAGKILLVLAVLPITGTLGKLPDYPLTNRQMSIRAGYFSESCKYLGGIPSVAYEDKFQLYQCTEFISDSSTSAADGNVSVSAEANATVCMEWEANELDSGVHGAGSCSCQSVANAEYCDAWSCNQHGVESTRCSCETENDDDPGNFCAFWTCVETDHDGTQEFGEYRCASPSSSTEFCETWTGVIEGSEEVEVSTCECVEQWDGVGVCSYWECKERSLEKCNHANTGWCNIGVSVGVGGFFGSVGAVLVSCMVFMVVKGDARSSERLVFAGAGLVWMSGWSAGVVIWGGGAVYVAIWWGAIIAGGLLYGYLDKNRDRITRCLATYRARVTQSSESLDQPIQNDGMAA